MERYLVDLHIHTSETSGCGRVPGREVVRAYREKGYSGIAITDHYGGFYFDTMRDLPWEEQVSRYMRGYEEALAEAKETDFRVYFGIEYRDRITDDDFLFFGIDRAFLLANPDLHDVSVKEAAARVHAYSGVVFQAHPARVRYAMAMGDELFMGFQHKFMAAHMRTGEQLPEIDWAERETLIGKPRQLTKLRVCNLREPESLDGIEVFNGNHTWALDPERTAQYLRDYPHFIRLSASDFHSYPAGMGGVYFDTLPKDDKELTAMLKEDRIVDYRTSHGEIVTR